MKRHFSWVVSILMVGCSQVPHKIAGQAHSEYQQKLWQKVAREIDDETSTSRNPAAAESVASKIGFQFGDLRGKNKSFELYVFPKVSQMAAMNSLKSKEVYLARPVLMSVHVPYASNCSYLKDHFNEIHPRKYFPQDLLDGPRSCAIIEITNTRVKELSDPIRKDGDELRKRMYLDDQFRVYGIESDYYSSGPNGIELKTAGLRYDGTGASTSGISFIPSEMIVMANVESMEPANSKSIFVEDVQSSKSLGYNYPPDRTMIDAIALRQIKRLNRKFSPPNCQYQKISYRDLLGSPGRMFWCQGASWPTVVDTVNFVAVASLRK